MVNGNTKLLTSKKCTVCNGEGKIQPERSGAECPHCEGTGRQSITVNDLFDYFMDEIDRKSRGR